MGKQKTTTTTTPNNPAWATGLVSGVADKATGLINSDPSSYVADWNNFQQSAADRAAALGNNPWLDEATKMINLTGNASAPSVTAGSLLDNLQSYISPYTGQVVDSTLKGFDYNAGQTRAAQSADMARAGAFGGSRAGIAAANTESGLARERAMTEAGLRDQAFNTGANLSGQDAQRRQQASEASASLAMQKQGLNAQLASQLAAMGFQQADSARADVNSLLGVGNTIYDAQTQQKQAPLSLLNNLSGVAGSLPLSNWTGQTQTSTGGGGLLSGLGSLAMGVGSLASGGLLGGLTSGLSGLTGAANVGGLLNKSKGLASAF